MRAYTVTTTVNVSPSTTVTVFELSLATNTRGRVGSSASLPCISAQPPKAASAMATSANRVDRAIWLTCIGSLPDPPPKATLTLVQDPRRVHDNPRFRVADAPA